MRRWVPPYLSSKQADARKAMDLAYGDVRRAFVHFIEQHNGSRPFFITAHSQGTQHAARLIQDVVDRDPVLAQRCVCAYTFFGCRLALPADCSHLQYFHPSRGPTDAPAALVHLSLRSGGGGIDHDPSIAKEADGGRRHTNGPGRWDQATGQYVGSVVPELQVNPWTWKVEPIGVLRGGGRTACLEWGPQGDVDDNDTGPVAYQVDER